MTPPIDAPAVDVSVLKPLNSKRDVADFIGASLDTINRLMRDGELGYYKRGHARQSSVAIGREHVADLLRRWER